jgi:hypothetical protein
MQIGDQDPHLEHPMTGVRDENEAASTLRIYASVQNRRAGKPRRLKSDAAFLAPAMR